MKKCLVIIFILLALYSQAETIKPQDYYYLNVRQLLSNYNDIESPAIDVFLYSVLEKDAAVSFRTSLIDMYPSEFILSLDSLKTGIFKHNVFIGDYHSPILGFSRINGIGFNTSFNHISCGIINGQNKDFYYTRFPTYYHNINQLLVYGGYSFGSRDTTQIYFINRNDDTEYNDYTYKNYIGLRHNSQIARVLNIVLDGQYADFHSLSDNYSALKGMYRMYASMNRLAISLRGEYVPADYISLNNMLFARGRFMNMISAGYRITDELSLYGNYQINRYMPQDNFSFDQYNIKISTHIPILPHMALSFYYSRYLETESMKFMMWRANAYKRLGGLLLDAVYANYNDTNIRRHTADAMIQYMFSNNARMGTIFNFSRTGTDNTYRYSGFIGWNPVKIWNMEIGTDYTLTPLSTYVSEYAKSSVNMGNMIFSTQLNLRFQDETYIRFTANLTLRDRLTDFHISGLSGYVFYDDNQNGQLDKNEETLEGINIRLNDSIIASTGRNGAYAFRFMKPGIYKLSLDMGKLPAYLDVRDDINVTLKNLRNTTFDIPLIKMSSVTGNVFEDYNKDGIKQPDEPGIGNVIVHLKDTKSYTYTDANGYYILSNLPYGNYIVEIPRMPEGFNYSIPNLINYISVQSVKQDYTIDFGLMKESKPVRKKVF